MPKREHGYAALIPVFIPVPKNDLPNQIAAATALHEAGQAGSLDAIMALPGIRLNVKPGKEIANRWTSAAAPEVQVGMEEGHPEFETEADAEASLDSAMNDELETPELDAASEADAATTTCRRSRARAA